MPNSNETTTKFKVDISELKSAMQTARKEVALANSEFKAASSGMDNWSKSSDGISAKLKQLNTNLASQKTVLKEYEKTLEEVKNEYGENSKEAMEYETKLNNQRAVVNQTEKQIRQFSEALDRAKEAERIAAETGRDASDVFDELGRSAEEAGDSAESSGGGFTVLKGALAGLVADGIKAVGAALMDLVTDSANAYAQFSASTGIATSAMGEYEDAIKSIYKNNFGESLADVAEKMARVKEVTGELDASKLQDMTEKAITLEDVFGMDMTETLRGVQSLMTHFGLTSEEAFDYLASGAQNGLNYTDELGDNIAEYAGKFAEAGYTTEEYFQLLQNGSKGGAYNLDKVNDAINEVTARLADGTIEEGLGIFSQSTQDAFKAWQNGQGTQKAVIDAITSDIRNTTGEQEKMNLAALAFGTMAEDGGTMFIESISAVGDSYTDVKGKAEDLANVKYDTPMSALSSIGRTLKVDLLQPMVDKLMPYLSALADWVETNLPAIIEKAQEIGDKIKEVIGFIEQISPLLAGVGTALAGLALVGVIQNISAIGTALKGAIMSTNLMTAAQWLLNVAMAANPITLIVIAIAALVAAFVVLWNKSEAFRNFWKELWDNLVKAFEVSMSVITKFFTETIPDTFNAVIDWIKKNWTTLLLFLINPFAGLFKYFYENNTKFKEFVDTAVNFIKEMPAKIWTWLLATIDKVNQWRQNMIQKAKDTIIGFVEKIIAGAMELPSKIWTWLLAVITKINQWRTDLIERGKAAAQGLFDAVVNGIKALPEKIKSIGADLVSGLWNGINDKVAWLKDKISGFVGDVTGWLKKFFGIESPSKVMANEVGKWLPEGIAVGINANADSALKSMKNLSTELVGTARAGLGSTSGTFGGSASVAGGVINNFTQINNSPKALNRLEIYRQSKNLLGYAGGI